MYLQNRKHFSRREESQGSYPDGFIILWVYANVFFAIIPMITNAFIETNESFHTQGNDVANE